MMHRLASLCVGLALLALGTSGCFAQQGDGVFGPGSGLADDAAGAPALSLKATPARGPGPLTVEFSLGARESEGDLSWTLDFGDRTAPAAGTDLPAKPRHTYKAVGAFLATFKVVQDSGESVSTLSIVVLEGLVTETGTPSPSQGPEPPPASDYQPPASPPPSSSSSDTGPTPTSAPNGTTSASGTTTAQPPPSSSTTEPPPPPPPSNSTSDSGTTSSTDTQTSSTDTQTSSDPSSSTTTTAAPPSPPDPEPSPSPTPTGSGGNETEPPM